MSHLWYGNNATWGTYPLLSPTASEWSAKKEAPAAVQPDSFWKSESAGWSPLLGLATQAFNAPLSQPEPTILEAPASPLPAQQLLASEPSLAREPVPAPFVSVSGLAGWNSASQQQHVLVEDIEQQLNKQCLYKTELCRSFEETGKCRYATKCQFAHGRAELRPVLRHPKYKTEICKTFQSTGSCPYSTRCRFIHLVPEETAKTEPAEAGQDAPRQKRTKRRSRRSTTTGAAKPESPEPAAPATPQPKEHKSRLSFFKQLVPLE